MADSLYEILGLGRKASQADIKKAYRRLARKHHPDVNPGDPEAGERFKRITEAYHILSDPKKRAAYDRFGMAGVAGEAKGGGPGGVQFEGFDFSSPGPASFADIIAELFGGGRRAARPPSGPGRGEDLHASIGLTFEEAVQGTQKALTLDRDEPCPKCSGAGASEGAGPCPSCSGKGKTDRQRSYMRFVSTCPSCGGTGRAKVACPECGGSGGRRRADTVRVNIPAGVDNGSTVRVPGKGNAGILGGPPGDLYIQTAVTPHPLFERKGDNLYVRVTIPLEVAAAGGTAEVPTLEGPTTVRIPPGTQVGQNLRLQGRGVLSRQSGRRGDLFVEIRVDIPRVSSPEARKLLEEFCRTQASTGDGAWERRAGEAS